MKKVLTILLAIGVLGASVPGSVFAALPLTNDLSFTQQIWALDQMKVREAWQTTTGDEEVVVAVIDDGIDMQHPDLLTNIWENTDEIAGNGIDDDANGYVDDRFGWDFSVSGSTPIQNRDFVPGTLDKTSVEDFAGILASLGITWEDLSDATKLQKLREFYDNHGTLVAGPIAATANNRTGIAGVNWNALLMNVPVFEFRPDDETVLRQLTEDQAIADKWTNAIRYATDNGADVINISLGLPGDSGTFPQLEGALKYAYDHGVSTVVSAGNDGASLDLAPKMPACSKYVLTVGATNSARQKTGFTNSGSCVDVFAPGEDILTSYYGYAWISDQEEILPTRTWINDDKSGSDVRMVNGTSFSAPYVAGVVALLKSKYPLATAEQIYERIIESATTPVYGSSTEFIVNAAEALAMGSLGPVIPDGTLTRIDGGDTIYYIEDSKLRLVPDAATFNARRWDWNSIQNYSVEAWQTMGSGEWIMPEGALIRAQGDVDVYIVKHMGDKAFKRLVLSPTVFNSYGHLRWEDIMDVPQATVDSFTTADLVRAVGDSQIYKLIPQGDTGIKQPISSAAISRLGLDAESIYEINSVDRGSYITGDVIN